MGEVMFIPSPWAAEMLWPPSIQPMDGTPLLDVTDLFLKTNTQNYSGNMVQKHLDVTKKGI